jgi:integrase
MAKYRAMINGRKGWMARVAYHGRRRSQVCTSQEEARQVAAELLSQLKAEAGRVEAEGQQPATMKALFEMYVADLEARGKGEDTIARAAQTKTAIANLLPALLTTPVSRIRDRDVYDFRQARTRAGVKPSTINRDLRTMRAALKAARPDFKFPGGAFFPEDETRVRWLRPEEELLVFDAMPQATRPTPKTASRALPFAAMARLAALTLMRQGEIRTLKREHVRLEQGVVMLPKAKAGARPVILSAEAQKILRGQLERVTGEWVFPGPDGRPYSRVHVSRVFRKASQGAGLRGFTFHDLRHHGATMALNRGFSAPIVQALGGWKTERMMKRYAAVTDQTLRAAAEAVSGAESAPRKEISRLSNV